MILAFKTAFLEIEACRKIRTREWLSGAWSSSTRVVSLCAANEHTEGGTDDPHSSKASRCAKYTQSAKSVMPPSSSTRASMSSAKRFVHLTPTSGRRRGRPDFDFLREKFPPGPEKEYVPIRGQWSLNTASSG